MPRRVDLARVPIMLNDYQNIRNGIRREWFIDYNKHNLYYIDKQGNVVGVGYELRELIRNTDKFASRIHIIRLDKGQLPPAIVDRRKNSYYYIVTKSKELRKEYEYDSPGNWEEPDIEKGVTGIITPGEEPGEEIVVGAHDHSGEVILPSRINVDELWINGTKITPTYFGDDPPRDDSFLWFSSEQYIPSISPTTTSPTITTSNPSMHNHDGDVLNASIIDTKTLYLRGTRVQPVVFSSKPPNDTNALWVCPENITETYPGDLSDDNSSYTTANNQSVVTLNGIHDHNRDVLIPDITYVDEIYVKGVRFTPFIYSESEPDDKSVIWTKLNN